MTGAALVALLVPILAGAAVLFIPERLAGPVAFTALVIGSAGAVILAVPVLVGEPLRAVDGLVVLDALGAFVLVITVMVAAIAAAGSPA
ncbi:MAG TPA: hypothetical protein VI277_06825, partial [Candidatus Limnocylindria bacterium]